MAEPRTVAGPQRILYYCQSLVGIGHLTASLRVIDELLQRGAAVDLVQGGLDAPSTLAHPRFRRLKLPTLLHDPSGGGFVDADGDGGDEPTPADGARLDAIWAARRRAIAAFLQARYDAIVVEFYPFGRRRFKPEILSMIDAVRASSGPLPVFCSVREVLVPRPPDTERRMVATVRKHIHTVFVRGDPAVVPFDETFTRAHEIAERIVHTGYIAAPEPSRRPPRREQVLVSQGGGDVGRELLQAAIGAAARLPGLGFLLVAGSRTRAKDLEALRRTVTGPNVEIVPFLADFPQRLMESRLSINMGGDNTLLDVLNARTPSLAYPYQDNPEQQIRIRRFAEKGLVHEIGPADLAPERLRQRIECALQAPYPAASVRMDGARVTAERILALLGGAPR